MIALRGGVACPLHLGASSRHGVAWCHPMARVATLGGALRGVLAQQVGLDLGSHPTCCAGRGESKGLAALREGGVGGSR